MKHTQGKTLRLLNVEQAETGGQKTGREILRSLAAGETRKLSEASRVSRHRSMGRYGC